jgi:acyl-CoA thioesterase
MLFSELLRSLDGADGAFSMRVSEDWGQGRATFGGLIAAAGNAALRRVIAADRPLRSLQTTFVGPASAGTWQLRTRVLRVGRAVTLAQCDVVDAGAVAATIVGVYGADRESAVRVPLAPTPSPRALDELQDMAFDPEHLPLFVQHFGMRWAEGGRPYSGVRSRSTVFIRHRDPAPLTESHVVALVDCIPSPALSMFKARAPASSLVWTLELLEHDYGFAPDAYWRIDTEIDAAGEGYVHQTGVLSDPNGRPVALSRQIVAVFG